MEKKLSLKDPVTGLRGVGPKKAEGLSRLGIETVFDLLTHFPFRYEDMTVQDISEIEDKQRVVLKGRVISEPVVQYYGRKKNRLNFRLNVEHIPVPVVFFNQPYLKKQVSLNEELMVFGYFDAKRKSLTGIKLIKPNQDNDFEAIYPSNANIKQNDLKKFIQEAFDLYGGLLPEILPDYLIEKYRLLSFPEAVSRVHFPSDEEDFKLARRTIVFLEFFLYQMRLQAIRSKEKSNLAGQQIDYDLDLVKTFIQNLPFEPTSAQKRVVNEIFADLKSASQMYRLLQGDVGSGKTLVAALAIIGVWTGGHQSALMAPTEILAEQHFKTLQNFYEDISIKVALLTSSTKGAERKEILKGLANGEIDLVIGTHALIQEEVHFQSLALAITDEQHRFGVNQRKALREKGEGVNVLYMTATPIPRTMAITAYGELDVSTIDELPKGRKPIKTHWVKPQHEEAVLSFIEKELASGAQVYVISPLIEESESLDLTTVNELMALYKNTFGSQYEISLLHGQMKNEEKEAVMQAFKDNQVQVLISTTVVEVGVDVPNASLMVIYDADRFGLATLHQLRGRVGRGQRASTCLLVANPRTETGVQRMQLMTSTQDGFLLSQKDLEMRGPGDFFGYRQSGLPDFKMADIIEDYPALETARKEAIFFYNSDEFKQEKTYNTLKTLIYQDGGKESIVD